MPAAEVIARALGAARPEGRGWWRCRCPIHGGTSLTLCDGPNGLKVKCWSGCASGAVRAALQQREFDARLAAESAADKAAREAVEAEQRRRRIADARWLWRSSHPAAENSIVAVYLWSRQLTMPVPPVLRLLGPQRHEKRWWPLPAMLARVDHVQHGFVGVSASFLNPLSPATRITETDDQPRRRFIGPILGGAVQLAPPGQHLVVAEGLENALSVMLATGLPAWAALSANGIASLVLPDIVRRVTIAADNDTAGLRLARRGARRWQAEGRAVAIATTGRCGVDFNDLLRA